MRLLYFFGGFIVGIVAERYYKPQINAACKKVRQSATDFKGKVTTIAPPAQD